jgi:lipopolysaccharide transport system ATP-binding protein
MIQVENISKLYRLGATKSGSYRTLRECITEGIGHTSDRIRKMMHSMCLDRRAERTEPHSLHALRDLSFRIAPGEAVGVIGHNGAGKSTLLKILGRITEPTSGRVILGGRIGSLLEVGTGFHPELTGRENIFLNGAILGMTRREVARKFDEIVSFAEVQEFLDTPVKRYSSGMYVRLGYSVAAHLEPDILLVDEVLSVGDLRFQRKCIEHAQRLVNCDATILLVSHNMFAIRALCKRALYLSHGKLLFDGPVDRAVELYERDSVLTTPAWAESQIIRDGTKPLISLTSIETYNGEGVPDQSFEHGERMRVRIGFKVTCPLYRLNFIVALIRSDNVGCCNYNTIMDGFELPPTCGAGVIELTTGPLKLVSETYRIHVLVRDETFQKLYCAQVGPSIQVHHDVLSTHFGVFHEDAEWSLVG